MKKFVISVSIAAVLFSVLVIIISSLQYQKVTDYYFDKKIVESISAVNKSASTTISHSIKRDYDVFLSFIKNKYNDNAINILSDLSVSDYGLGYITVEDGNELYTINSNVYLINKKTNDNISILNLKKDFTKSNLTSVELDETYLIFRSNNEILYFLSDDYFNTKFVDTNNFIENNCFIIHRDGVICYQSLEKKRNQFYYYLREYNDEAIVEKFKTEIASNESSTLLTLKEEDHDIYLSYSQIDNLLNNDYLVINIFNKDVVRVSQQDLLTPTIGSIVAYSIVVIIGIWVCYGVIIKKNSDLYVARLVYGADKSLVIRVNNKGDITYLSENIKKMLNDDYPKNINEYDTLERHSSNIEALTRNSQVTLILKKDDVKKYLSFISIKTLSGFRLIGLDLITKERLKGLQKEVMYNEVTKLPNERILLDDLEEYFKLRSIRKTTDSSDSIKINKVRVFVVAEILGFKDFESVFGANTGNLIIKQIASNYQESIKSIDATIYHISDGLFGIFFSEKVSEDEVITWIKLRIEEFKRPLLIEENSLVINANYGVSLIDLETFKDLTPNQVISNALAALKKTKSYVGQLYSVYDLSLNTFLSKEQLMESELRYAIDHNEFIMHLQPQYNNEQERIGGFEALIRWNNPKYIRTSPAHFIEFAEKNNMIVKLGHFIITETFRIAKSLEQYNVTISMNVSPVQLLQAGFVNEILEEFNKVGLRRNSIAIEITETFLMNNFKEMVEKMKILRDNGFDIHLDDFGTGYSSMLYLRELPINCIKIDKEFTKHINTDKYSQAIVSKIISLAKILDLECIAEGVEDEKQNNFLYRNGCDIIQGYLISPPVNVEKALGLIEEYNIKKRVVIKKTKTTKKL